MHICIAFLPWEEQIRFVPDMPCRSSKSQASLGIEKPFPFQTHVLKLLRNSSKCCLLGKGRHMLNVCILNVA